jgi:hypothetical protein
LRSPRPRPSGSEAAVEDWSAEVVLRAATLFDLIRSTRWGNEIRQRIGRLTALSSEGSRFDSLRREFIHLTARLPDPLGEDFGRLHDEHGSYIDYPRRIVEVVDTSKEYGRQIDEAARAGRLDPAAERPTAPPEPAPRDGVESGVPAPAGRPSPQDTVSSWLDCLKEVKDEILRERVWGCDLLVECWVTVHAPGARAGDSPVAPAAQPPGDGPSFRTGGCHAVVRGLLIAALREDAAVLDALRGAATYIMRVMYPVEHGPDYRSVVWFGTPYQFSKMRADAVAVLWDAWERGTPDVSEGALKQLIGSDSERSHEVLRDHPAWRRMIDRGVPGCLRLLDAPC